MHGFCDVVAHAACFGAETQAIHTWRWRLRGTNFKRGSSDDHKTNDLANQQVIFYMKTR